MGVVLRFVLLHWLLVLLVDAHGLNFANFPTIEEFLGDPVINDDRIVGGEEAVIENHPYQASMVVDNKFFCGCFIISENWIMTAAHCAQGVDPSTVELKVGSSWRKNGTRIPIAKVIWHPEWDNPRFDKDVAVMQTEKAIEFNEFVQPIDLPPLGRDMKGGTEVVVSGWGRTEQGANSLPERLMAVRIPVIYYSQCWLTYYTVMTRNMWCGGNFFLGGQGTCQGDSGGAAVQDGMAVGIVSYGRGCAQSLAPSVFADIASPDIREFIKKHTGL